MNAIANPQRIIATNIRTTAEQLDAWRDLYAVTYPKHRLSLNAWLISMIQEGVTVAWYAADCPPTQGSAQYPRGGDMEIYQHPSSGETFVIGVADGRKVLLGPCPMRGDPPVPCDPDGVPLTDALVDAWSGNLGREDIEEMGADYDQATGGEQK